jgi:Domain of unknown function (DUF4157)/Annexin
MRGRALQRRCACGGTPGPGGECAACRAKRLQRQAVALGPAVAPPIVHEVLGSPGRPLERGVRGEMEARFGHDFSQVRVHTGERAAASAQAVSAAAYTVGRDVVFGAGAYTPRTVAGRSLLAHELAHVVQQQGAAPTRGPLPIDDPGGVHERQAEHSASAPGATQSAAPVGVARAAAPTSPAPDTGGLSPEMLSQIARRLREAMAGLGTDESAIYAALGGRAQSQVDAVARTYAALFGRSLSADLRGELNDSELLELGMLAPQYPAGAPEAISAAEQGRLADTVARQLDDAMRGLGTDESAIFSALTGRTQAERTAIKQAYQRRTGRTLEADLNDELSGSELTEALMLLNQGMLQVEDELYLAMAGLGTDEDRIFRALDPMARDIAGLQAMERRYRDKYGDLVADLRGDLSGEDYAHALRVLRPAIQDVAFEDVPASDRAQVIGEIRTLIPVGIARVERAISVLSRGWSGMSAAEQAVFNQYFDPSGSGIDQQFVAEVLANFRSIRREFDNDLTVEYEPSGAGLCSGGRLYYTYWSNIHVCPYFKTETDPRRKARDFVHELTHNALLAVDRPYYVGQRAAYNRMTPRGPWTRNIPFLGPLFTFISRSDTLNSPDAYAYFAFDV